MKQRLFIQGRIPALNDMIDASKSRTRFRVPVYAHMKKRTDTAIFFAIKQAKIRPVKQAKFTFIWCEKNKRRDKDNIAAGKKFILDAFVAAKIIRNDGWDCVICLEDHFCVAAEKEKIGVIVILEEVDPKEESLTKYQEVNL